MKKFFNLFILVVFILNNFLVFSNTTLSESNLYYLDTDNNGKIDRLEIEFNNELTGSLNTDKLFLYSNTGGLSSSKLDSVSGNSIFSSYSLSGNILIINLVEQSNFLTGLIINNTTSSHLRLKTNAGVGIKDIFGNEIKLLYTSSFTSYANTYFKNIQTPENSGNIVEEIIPPETASGTINPPDILEETGSTNQNPVVEENIPETNSGTTQDTDSGRVSTGSLEQEISTGTISSFSGKILFQSPSYLLEKDSTGIINLYNCDRTKTDCKVNFNLNIDFGSGFDSVSTAYECIWNFGFGEITGEEEKCNPNTITYPVGEWETTYMIREKSNTGHYIENKIKIKNEGFREESVTRVVYVSSSSSTQTTNTAISIYTPKINIQGGLDENNNCKKDDCNINLSYYTKNSKEACLWSFPGGNYEIGTDKKCNPGYIKYPFGDFKVSLRVYEIGNESNYKEADLSFSNKEKIEKIETKKEDKSQSNISENHSIEASSREIDEKNFRDLKDLKISKILANPIGNDDLEWIELKNIGNQILNLNGCEIDNELKSSTKKYRIEKDLSISSGASMKFFKIDTGITIKNTGSGKLNLLCLGQELDNMTWNFDNPEGFVVDRDVLKSGILSIKKSEDKNKFDILLSDGNILKIDKYKSAVDDLLKEVNTETGTVDETKKAMIKDFINNSFTQKVSKQKKGIKIYGTTLSNAKVLLQVKKSSGDSFSILDILWTKAYAESKDIYELEADTEGKYELFIKNPELGEFAVLSTIKSSSGYNFDIPTQTSFDVDKDYVDYISDSETLSSTNIESIINMQGKLGENKTLVKNKIVCSDTDECSVNFDGRGSKGNNLGYFWDFGNGKTFNKANPASYKFGPGEHIISLKVLSGKQEDKSYFIVEVFGKEKKEKSKKLSSESNFISTANADSQENIENIEDEENIGFTKTQIIISVFLFLLTMILFVIVLKRREYI